MKYKHKVEPGDDSVIISFAVFNGPGEEVADTEIRLGLPREQAADLARRICAILVNLP